MKIKWHIQSFERFPEWPVLRKVVIHRRIGCINLRESVHERPLESKLLYASCDLSNGSLRILHRERGKSRETIGPSLDLFSEKIVRNTRYLGCAFYIRNGLDGGRVQGQNHHFNAVLIHEGQSLLIDIE